MWGLLQLPSMSILIVTSGTEKMTPRCFHEPSVATVSQDLDRTMYTLILNWESQDDTLSLHISTSTQSLCLIFPEVSGYSPVLRAQLT